MSEKKKINDEQLQQVSGGSVVPIGGPTKFSLDYGWRVLSIGDHIEVFRISDDCDLGYWPVVNKYKENGNKVIVAQDSSNQTFEMGDGKPYVFGTN